LDHFTIMPPEKTMNTMAHDHIRIAQQPNFTYTLEDRYVRRSMIGVSSTPTRLSRLEESWTVRCVRFG